MSILRKTIHVRTLTHAALCLVLLAAAVPTHAQSRKGKASSKGGGKPAAVATIGTHTLTLPEYEQQYIRNNGGPTAAVRSSMDERTSFLDLLVNYRLKVLEAMDKGYDKDPDVVKELTEYRNSLAVPYITERVVVDPAVKDLHQKRMEEVRVAHILIRIQQDSLGVSDTVSALTKALDVLRQAQAGERFDSLAVRFSDDQGSAKNGGDLGFFTAGMTVPSFDNAAYTLKVNEIFARPVRTMFGYHIVKLLQRQPSRGEIHVAHILVRFPQDAPQDTSAAWAKITAIRDSLSTGVSFAALAERNSDDPGSAPNGGDLGWVGRRRFVPEFETAAFALKAGEMSGIVRTNFGYHIIFVSEERPPKSFEDSKQELKDLYRRYGYDTDVRRYTDDLRAKRGVVINQDVMARVIANVDTTATTSAAGWYNKIPADVLSAVIISMQGGTVTVDAAVKTIERNQDMQSKPLTRQQFASLVEVIAEKEVFRLETADLEQRYPEFAGLMQEYREGVLLFRAEQDAVWNKVKVEEAPLRTYWSAHKSEYTWPDRVQFSEIFVTNDSLARVLRDSLTAGVDFSALAERQTQRSGYRTKKGDWGLQPVDANELTKKAADMTVGAIEGPVKFQYGYSIIRLTGKDASREKTFEEAQSEVSSKFQEYESKRLEQEWLAGLRKKFPVKQNVKLLEKAFSTLDGGGK